MAQGPYVFISYSHESDEHVHRVLTLTQWLRNNGIDAYVDKFEESPPEIWQLWCYEQVQKASYVLVVCTETYERRVLRQEHGGIGRGADWESAIITNEIYDRTRDKGKFIPVIFASQDVGHVPFFLTNSTVYDLSDERSLRALLSRITLERQNMPAPVTHGTSDSLLARLRAAAPTGKPPPPGALRVPSEAVHSTDPTERPAASDEEAKARNAVFICYARADQGRAKWIERLNEQLSGIARFSAFRVWHDGRIAPGTDWRGEIRGALESCRAAVLLIGPAFLTSDFINTEELPALLAAREQEGVSIFPVITNFCAYEKSPLGRFQSVNDPRKPLQSLPRAAQDRLILTVAEQAAAAAEANATGR